MEPTTKNQFIFTIRENYFPILPGTADTENQ